MGIGIGITLLVVGGIAAFGIRVQWSAIDLTAIGYICMGVGAVTSKLPTRQIPMPYWLCSVELACAPTSCSYQRGPATMTPSP